MLSSKFSDMLSATFVGALSLAAAADELAVAYGAESGRIDERLEQFAQRGQREGGLILSRSHQSQLHFRSLGLNSERGADTAWTYDPPPDAKAVTRASLLDAGWDGRRPIAIVCPMDPFCWPVRVDLGKARAMRKDGSFKDQHYAGLLFCSASDEAEASFASYLSALRELIGDLSSRGYYPILVGMERLDGRTCARLQAILPQPVPAYISGTVPASEIVALLHSGSLVVTSRFHAAVLSLNAGVRTIGIALDERIRNLFSEAGLEEWFVSCDDRCLGEKLTARASALRYADVGGLYAALMREQIEMIGLMGVRLHDEVVRVYPDFPEAPLKRDWRAYLPPLSERIEAML